MKDLNEIIRKIEGDQHKIADIRKILGYECFTENARNRVEAIDNLWRCAEFAETVEGFLKNADEEDGSISVEVQRLMQRYIEYGLGIKRQEIQENSMKCVELKGKDSARIIGSMQDKISREAEIKYLKTFARQNWFDEEIGRNQLRCLWTAYCFHHGLDVDTLGYDNDLFGLWGVMMEEESETMGWKDYDSFDNFMCKYLV